MTHVLLLNVECCDVLFWARQRVGVRAISWLWQAYDSSVRKTLVGTYVDTPGRRRASLKGIKALGVRVLGSRHAGNMSNSCGRPNRARSG